MNALRDRSEWITLDCERVLYVHRGRDVILCDRLSSPITLVLKVLPETAAALRAREEDRG